MSTQTNQSAQAKIIEYPLKWPGQSSMSTHELVADATGIYVTGQNMHCLAKVTYAGVISYHPLPDNSGPHGILLDKHGQLWVSLEFAGTVVRLDKNLDNDKTYNIVQTIDVHMNIKGSKTPINPAPHGIGLDADGETIWFTGKRTSSLGKINPEGTVEHFELPSLGGVPIFLSAGADGKIWGTELLSGKILHSGKDGKVEEFPAKTPNLLRPIAIIPDPSEPYMWFTEESGNMVSKIDMQGNITEFHIPQVQKNDILASLSFDNENNLWVQCYVDQNNKLPAGNDYIIKLDKSIRHATGGEIAGIPIVWNKVPSQNTMMHRIRMGMDGNMWFTEMGTNILGKIVLVH